MHSSADADVYKREVQEHKEQFSVQEEPKEQFAQGVIQEGSTWQSPAKFPGNSFMSTPPGGFMPRETGCGQRFG